MTALAMLRTVPAGFPMSTMSGILFSSIIVKLRATLAADDWAGMAGGIARNGLAPPVSSTSGTINVASAGPVANAVR